VSLRVSSSNIHLTLTSHDAMGVRMVQRSTALGTPVIFVSMNYRWGFTNKKSLTLITMIYIMTGSLVRNNSTESYALCLILSTYLKAFGFLGGKEVFEEEVGNLGLWDRKHSSLV